jgi:hypothetical protein
MLDHPLGQSLPVHVETKYYSAALDMLICDTVDGAEKVKVHEGCIVLLPAEVKPRVLVVLGITSFFYLEPPKCSCVGNRFGSSGI